MQKSLNWPEVSTSAKNLQFLSNLANIKIPLLTHELVFLAKLHKDWAKIVKLLVIQKEFDLREICWSPKSKL